MMKWMRYWSGSRCGISRSGFRWFRKQRLAPTCEITWNYLLLSFKASTTSSAKRECCLLLVSPSPHSALTTPTSGFTSAIAMIKPPSRLPNLCFSFLQRSLLDSSCRHLVQTSRYVQVCAVFQLLVCDQVDAETDKWFYKNWLRIICCVGGVRRSRHLR